MNKDPSRQDPLEGQILGKYQVLEKIGQGGMGMVYRGRQMSLNRSVAIKVLPGQMAADEDFVRRFLQEAEVIARLTHENIVHVYDIDRHDGTYYIVMEYVDGHSLREYRGQPQPTQQIQAIGIPVARALDYAHARGIVHRDVKSTNVMVTSEGKVKLMDFGIAKAAGGVKTLTGSVLGTPEYMAPEQARGGSVTAQSDVYALGVLLYEMAVGALPFAAEDPFAIALKHISEQPVPPQQRQPAIPDWLDRVILKALEKGVDARYASAAALEEDLLRGAGQSTDKTPGFMASTHLQLDETIPLPTPSGLATERHPTPAPASGSSLAVGPTIQAASATVPAPQATPTPAPTPPAATVSVTAAAPSAAGPTETTPTAAAQSETAPSKAGRWLLVAAALTFALIAGLWAGRNADSSGPAVADDEQTAAALPSAALEPTSESSEPLSSEEQATPLLAGERTDLRLRLLLDQADLAHEEGNLEAARGFVGEALELAPDHPPAVALQARLATAQAPPPTHSRPTTSERPVRPGQSTSGPTATGSTAPEQADSGQTASPPSATLRTAPPTTPTRKIPITELWRRAEDLKDDGQFHSLEAQLDRILKADPQHRKARTWTGKIDSWIREQKSDLEDDIDSYMDDFAEGIEDQDLGDLEDLWDGRWDDPTRRYFSDLFDRYAVLRMTYTFDRIDARDNRADFLAEIEITGKLERGRKIPFKRVLKKTWRGRYQRIHGKRFAKPFPG